MAAKILSLFNHKGGVSKTTTTFNLAWALANAGKKILMVDTDPQCNLTGLFLSIADDADFKGFYEKNPNSNIYSTLKPAFSGSLELLPPAAPVTALMKNLYLLGGHIEFSTFEAELVMATKLIDAMPVMQNLPGAFGYLIRKTAEHINADFVLIDMSPSVGSLNQNILMHSDYFIVPTSPDYFCYMAIHSLCKVLPRWNETQKSLQKLNYRLTYKVPENPPKFIGMLSQKFRPRNSRPSRAFQNWIDTIVESINNDLIPVLNQYNMSVDKNRFESVVGNNSRYELAQIADFNSLIATSQDNGVPIFDLTEEMLGHKGTVLENSITSRDAFRVIFSKLANDVIKLAE